jgi:outer membrane protein assembly factor BamE
MTKITKLILIIVFTFVIAGCYHPDIQQGNNLTAKQVSQLKLGMSQAEVVNLLGTPILNDVFNSQRLVYIYTMLPNGGEFLKKKMILYFKHNKLVKIVGNSSFASSAASNN